MHYLSVGPFSDRPGREGHRSPSEDEYNEFYVSYGEAMAAWASIEQNLFAVFHFHASPQEYAVGPGIYWTLQGFRTRLDVTDAVVAASGRAAERLREWEGISGKLRKKSQNRNKLAHFSPCYGREREGMEYGMFLGNPQNPFKDSVLKIHDLKAWAIRFDELAHETIGFFLKAVEEKRAK